MSLDDLGNLGEFIASIAVIISLIYLAVQLRRNTQQLASSEKSLQRNESTTAHEQWSAFRHLMINNTAAAEVWLRGQKDLDSLSELEYLQFTNLAIDQFFIISNMRERHLAGVSDPALWERNIAAGRRFLDSPGGKKWWEAHKSTFVDELVREIEDAR